MAVDKYRRITDWKELRDIVKDREPVKTWNDYEKEEKDNDE